MNQDQEGQEEAKGEGLEAQRAQGLQGQEELRDEAAEYLSLDFILKSIGSVECVTQSGLHFSVPEDRLKRNKAGGRKTSKEAL